MAQRAILKLLCDAERKRWEDENARKSKEKAEAERLEKAQQESIVFAKAVGVGATLCGIFGAMASPIVHGYRKEGWEDSGVHWKQPGFQALALYPMFTTTPSPFEEVGSTESRERLRNLFDQVLETTEQLAMEGFNILLAEIHTLTLAEVRSLARYRVEGCTDGGETYRSTARRWSLGMKRTFDSILFLL